MKKKAILLVILILMSGCTIVRIDTKSIDNIIDVVLSKQNNLYNQIGKGYKYYIPRGVSYINTSEYNDTLYSNGNYYYLYIDVVGYYYKKNITYEESNNQYYFKKIQNADKTGFVSISKVDDKYLIDFAYNFSRIEAMVDKDEINDVILNASYILSTIKYNSSVIKIMLDDDYFKNKEEKYTVFEQQGNNNDFFPIYEDDTNTDESAVIEN